MPRSKRKIKVVTLFIYLFFAVAQQPILGLVRPIVEVYKSHTHTHTQTSGGTPLSQ